LLRRRQLNSYSRIPQHFMETEGSLPCSQEPGMHRRLHLCIITFQAFNRRMIRGLFQCNTTVLQIRWVLFVQSILKKTSFQQAQRTCRGQQTTFMQNTVHCVHAFRFLSLLLSVYVTSCGHHDHDASGYPSGSPATYAVGNHGTATT
jgi:hypothetical protein